MKRTLTILLIFLCLATSVTVVFALENSSRPSVETQYSDTLRYVILEEVTKDKLQTVVTKYIKAGWTCAGGIYVVVDANGTERRFVQSMIKQ